MKRYLPFYVICTLLGTASCTKAVEETRPIRKDLVELVFASGVLEADGENGLTAQTDGFIVRMNFKEGDLVAPRQLLAVIDNAQNRANASSARVLSTIAQNNTRPSAPALLQAGANVAAAKAKMQLDQLQAERYKRLYAANSVSLLEYQNVVLAATTSKAAWNAARQQYDALEISARQQAVVQQSAASVNDIVKDQNQVRAIIAGRVYQKQKQLGDYVRKGDVIAVIASQQLIYAKLSVDESNMASLKTGQQVIIQLNTNKHKNYKAILHEILPSFDTGTQSFLVKAYFTDSLGFRIAGTQLQANIVTGEKKNALVIPRNYLLYGDRVYLKNKKVVPVKTGIISSDWVEILGGINEQDLLIPDLK